MTTDETPKDRADQATEDEPDEEGRGRDAGGSDSSDTQAPFAPHEDDDSELGDTDQHSDA